jgi:Polyferredoxin
VIGFWRNTLLSLVALYGWLTSGISITTQWIMLSIAALAIFLPIFTRKPFYCAYLCPMGALQEFSGKVCKKKAKLSNAFFQVLLVIRKLFLLTIFILLVAGVSLDLAMFEPFSVFNWQNISIYAIVFAVLILILSLFINRFWCRFLCPTGLLLELAREVRGKKKIKK